VSPASRRSRTGRRPGKQDTRETILTSARQAFAETGYDGTSIRQIASGAGVDPALVHHYFGTKEQLFLDVVRPPFDPEVLLRRVFDGSADGVPERLVRTFLSVWEGPVSGPAIRGLLRRGVAHHVTGRLLREFFTTQVVRQLASHLRDEVDADELPLRATLVSSQLLGLGVTRYILELEPLASQPVEVVVAATAPTVRRYLFEELPPSSGPPCGGA
jgi:AcrR family transcriptional regulator